MATARRDLWLAEELETLKRFAEARRDWIAEARRLLPHRSVASIQWKMQMLRAENGLSRWHCGPRQKSCGDAWMADAVNGSRMLLARLEMTGLRP